MPEKTESLEQAARDFLSRQDIWKWRWEMAHPDSGLSEREREIKLVTSFAAERERQVWAEAAKFVDTFPITGSAFERKAMLVSEIARKRRARGEQVKWKP